MSQRPEAPAVVPAPVPAPASGRPAWRVLIVLVVVAALVAVFFGVDTYVHNQTEQRIATQQQEALGTPTLPQVDIPGRPFLTQVAARRIRAIHIVADQVGQTTQAPLPLEHVDVQLSGVTTNDWWKTSSAEHVEGTATLDYAVVKAQAGVPLSYLGGGRFGIDASPGAFGLTVPATVTGRLALDVKTQTLSVTEPTLSLNGTPMPDVVAKAIINALVKPIPITGVPYGLRITSVDPQDDGLHVGISGDDVPLQR